MNKLLKNTLFSNLEVSMKLSYLVTVQRMSTSNFNHIGCIANDQNSVATNKDEKEYSNIVIPESFQKTIESNGKSVLYNTDYNTVSKICYHYFSEKFSYPFYSNIHCGFSFYWKSRALPVRHYFHSGQNNPKNWKLNRNLSKKMLSLRSWEKIADTTGTKPGFIFTLMSYNVLAQDILEQHPHLYKYHDTESLTWPIRWNNLFKEITRLQPDILCLQEVQESHLAKYYSQLENLGYEFVFKKRTGDDQPDGCAIFYKTDNITLIEYNVVEYFKPIVKLLNRHNVGILMKFAPKLHPTREFVVVTTHLLYNPRRDDVRMAQMQLLLTDVEKMSFKRDGRLSYYLPVIVTGDLNSPPYSDLYEFVTKGNINYEQLSPNLLETNQHSNRKILVTSSLGITDTCQHERVLEKRENDNSIFKNNEKKSEDQNHCKIQIDNTCTQDQLLSHNFNLKSVYSHGKGEINEGTTYQDEWLTVDYIFYSLKRDNQKENLKLLSRCRLPTIQELEGLTIPNNFLGSDHLSLMAKFKLEF